MKKTEFMIKKLLEELERTPLIQVACEKIGISRNTFYRWAKEDKELAEQVSQAISLGTGVVNDVAVSNVLNGIQKGDPMYTKYWLSHKHPDFRKPFILKYDDDVIQYRQKVKERSQFIRLQSDAHTELFQHSEEHTKEMKRIKELFRKNAHRRNVNQEHQTTKPTERERMKELVQRRNMRNQ